MTLEMGLHKITWELYKASLDRTSPSADAGYNELMVQVSDPLSRSLVAKSASRSIRLNFVGPLSLVPSIGSFKICTFDGQDVFMRSNVTKGPLCDFVTPAWLVEKVPLHAETGEPMQQPSMEIGKATITVDFKWAKCFLGSQRQLTIPVSLFYLSIAQTCIGMQNLELKRQYHEDEILEFKPQAATFNKAMAERTKGMRSSGPGPDGAKKTSKQDKEWQQLCKHILT